MRKKLHFFIEFFGCFYYICLHNLLNSTYMNTTEFSNALVGTPLFNAKAEKVGHYIESTNTVVVESIPTEYTELYVHTFHETIGFWIYVPMVTICPDGTFIDHTLTVEAED